MITYRCGAGCGRLFQSYVFMPVHDCSEPHRQTIEALEEWHAQWEAEFDFAVSLPSFLDSKII